MERASPRQHEPARRSRWIAPLMLSGSTRSMPASSPCVTSSMTMVPSSTPRVIASSTSVAARRRSTSFGACSTANVVVARRRVAIDAQHRGSECRMLGQELVELGDAHSRESCRLASRSRSPNGDGRRSRRAPRTAIRRRTRRARVRSPRASPRRGPRPRAPREPGRADRPRRRSTRRAGTPGSRRPRARRPRRPSGARWSSSCRSLRSRFSAPSCNRFEIVSPA